MSEWELQPPPLTHHSIIPIIIITIIIVIITIIIRGQPADWLAQIDSEYRRGVTCCVAKLARQSDGPRRRLAFLVEGAGRFKWEG